jgi:hypothetical protein
VCGPISIPPPVPAARLGALGPRSKVVLAWFAVVSLSGDEVCARFSLFRVRALFAVVILHSACPNAHTVATFDAALPW